MLKNIENKTMYEMFLFVHQFLLSIPICLNDLPKRFASFDNFATLGECLFYYCIESAWVTIIIYVFMIGSKLKNKVNRYMKTEKVAKNDCYELFG